MSLNKQTNRQTLRFDIICKASVLTNFGCSLSKNVWPTNILIYTTATVSTVKQFAYNILLFFIIDNAKTSAYELNLDLQNKSEWVYQWKMLFDPDQNE